MKMGGGDTDKNQNWYYQRTKRRVEYWITAILSLSVFIGTVLWGYGLNPFLLFISVLWLFIAFAFKPSPYIIDQ